MFLSWTVRGGEDGKPCCIAWPLVSSPGNGRRCSKGPESRLRWNFIRARRSAVYLPGKPLHLATRNDAEGFLSKLASSPGITAWQVEQATDALTILPGSACGQEWAREGPGAGPSSFPLRPACRWRRSGRVRPSPGSSRSPVPPRCTWCRGRSGPSTAAAGTSPSSRAALRSSPRDDRGRSPRRSG